jgi:tRNA U38,U39,U40 pseudouridine synthase TruA
MITQTLIESGLGNISSKEIKDMLDKKDKTVCSYNAVASGLYLVKVGYNEYEEAENSSDSYMNEYR